MKSNTPALAGGDDGFVTPERRPRLEAMVYYPLSPYPDQLVEGAVRRFNPYDDSDDDDLTDGEEVDTHGTDPLDDDSDSDELTDGDEVNTHNTDPLNPDTDGNVGSR